MHDQEPESALTWIRAERLRLGTERDKINEMLRHLQEAENSLLVVQRLKDGEAVPVATALEAAESAPDEPVSTIEITYGEVPVRKFRRPKSRVQDVIPIILHEAGRPLVDHEIAERLAARGMPSRAKDPGSVIDTLARRARDEDHAPIRALGNRTWEWVGETDAVVAEDVSIGEVVNDADGNISPRVDSPQTTERRDQDEVPTAHERPNWEQLDAELEELPSGDRSRSEDWR